MAKDMKLRSWVDASYGVHHDFRGHTGGVISMGGGILHHKTSKQKLNTKSSTESELVGASDYLPHTIWFKRFLAQQGYKVKGNFFYQDNVSAIRLGSNGFASRGEKSKHINIRYFFIKDVLNKEEIRLVHCPTTQMVADYFTKPLQGRLFTKIRDQIMGHADILAEERVGDKEKGGNINKKMTTKISPGGKNERRMTYAEAVTQERRM